MKHLLMGLMLCILSGAVMAQEDSSYIFDSLVDLSTTSVKDQNRSGTCWSFSGLSFVESEVLRNGGDSLDLSEMYVVRKCYEYKAEKYLRMHGKTNFGGGGAFFDVFWVMNNYGLLPEKAYKGLNYGEEGHVHGELDNVLEAFVDAIVQNKNKKISTAWEPALDGILDAYFGTIPESIDYNGKTYNAQSFRDDVLKLDASDYISITSFTHHPFYEQFVLEIPDNWLWASSYNLPLNEMMEVMRYAVDNGYSIAGGGDVSERGFSHKNGLAIVPDVDVKDMTDSERSKWEKMSQLEKDKKLYKFDKPGDEKVITQELRQKEFDNFKTTDDHGMHITGLVKDQNGKYYYKVKNSWNTDNKYDGYLYMSEPYVELKTMNFVIHKDALPKTIKKKLHIQ